MDPYRILIPNGMTNNPFLFQLVRSLQRRPEVAAVQYGTRWLADRSYPFDAVLVQWPEAMVDWKETREGDLERFRETLGWWRESGTAVAATVHNTIPHFEEKVNEHTRRLYELVYGSSDAIVHLGEASREALREQVTYHPGTAHETVIPHGNYEFFGEPVGREEARRRLGLEEGPLLLSLGTIRSDEEMELLWEASRHAGGGGGRLLVAGRLPHTDRKEFGYWRTRIPLRFNPHLQAEERFIPDEEVRYYVEACDALLVPRIRSLNSGNVLLGFTYGRVVIGPDRGVIGEELRARGNPVFEPGSEDELENAIARGFELAGSGLGDENRRFALEERNWDGIASRYVELIKRLKPRQE